MVDGVSLPQAGGLSDGSWRWRLAIVLFLATVLTYLDQQTLSLWSAMICGKFNLSDELYGQLVAASRWAYAVMHIPTGFLADRDPV